LLGKTSKYDAAAFGWNNFLKSLILWCVLNIHIINNWMFHCK